MSIGIDTRFGGWHFWLTFWRIGIYISQHPVWGLNFWQKQTTHPLPGQDKKNYAYESRAISVRYAYINIRTGPIVPEQELGLREIR